MGVQVSIVFSAYNNAIPYTLECPDEGNGWFGCNDEIYEKNIILVGNRIEEWSCKHECPIENIHDW